MSRKMTVLAIVILSSIVFAYYAHHTRTESFDYIWYPDDSYAPAQKWPGTDAKGQPKVVLVRSVGNLQCYAVYYDKRLAGIVEQHPTRPVRVTFRVKVRFGRPYWTEVIETAGVPDLAWGQLGQHGRGECF